MLMGASKHRLIFLDFDGVLHPVNAMSSKWFSRGRYLHDAVSDHRDTVRFVVSSSVRLSHPLEELQPTMPPSLGSLLIGMTPTCSTNWHRRYMEITTFVAGHKDCVDWRALDDNPNGYPENCPQLILCDRRAGVRLIDSSGDQTRTVLAFFVETT